MERFTSLEANYSFLAKYYDELLGDKEAYLSYLPYVKKKGKVLELASGNGDFALLLKENDYDIIASDISKEMKEVAINKGYSGQYLILDMRDFILEEKFETIVCINDSFNYLKPEELDSYFDNIAKHLKEKGEFIFDSHHPLRLKEFENEYIEEGQLSEINYQWTIVSDTINKTLSENFVFFSDSGTYLEQHLQYVYEIEEIKEVASKYFDLEFVEIFEAEKILIRGIKK